MAIPLNAPVTQIEGIGPATARLLAHHHVQFAFDLVLVNPEALHSVVSRLASLNECQKWIQAAHLLQVEEVTPQWAEALVEGGVTTVEMLALANLDDLVSLFDRAEQSGLIPGVPQFTQIAKMVRDATAIFYTASVSGRVVDSTGKGIEGAKVEIKLATAYTNENGYFRVLKVPLGGSPMLIISHDDFETRVVSNLSVVYDDNIIALQTHILSPRPTEEANDSSPALAPSELDELLGDTLPPASAGLELKTERQAGVDPRVGDILMLHKLYKRSPDAMLQSRFRSFRDGKIIIRTYKVPVNSLPSGLKVKDHVERRTNGFVAIKITPERLGRRKAMRRIRSRHSYSPETRQERMNHIMNVAAELMAEPEFGPIRRRSQGGTP